MDDPKANTSVKNALFPNEIERHFYSKLSGILGVRLLVNVPKSPRFGGC